MNHLFCLQPFRPPCAAALLNLPTAQRECGHLLRRGATSASQCRNSDLSSCLRPYSLLSRPLERRSTPAPFTTHQAQAQAQANPTLLLHPRPRHQSNHAPLPPPTTAAGIFRSTFRFLRGAMDSKDPLDGPRFRSKDLTQDEITRIFGPGVPADIGNRMLRFQHGRRLDGELDDDSDSPAHDLTKKMASTALAWLRLKYPMDEKAAYKARMEREEGKRQTEIVADAERLGIYKPQSGVKAGDVYGKSGLDEIREEYARRAKEKRERREKEQKKRQMEEVKRNTGALLQKGGTMNAAEMKPVETPKWVVYYRERAVLSHTTVAPTASNTARILPSLILTLLVVAGSVIFAEIYTFPAPTARLWADIPPAAATILGLILLNTVVLLAWRIPPLWRPLNKYFISVPGYPYAFSIVGNIFSHQQFSHYLINMAILWYIGTKLHDQIGRANFLAIYLSAGVVGSLLSLSSYVLAANLVSSSLGASGAITGIMGCWCLINSQAQFRLLFIPEDWLPPFSSTMLLVSLLAVEVTGIVFRFKGVDHWAHLGGFLTGMAGAEALKWQWRKVGRLVDGMREEQKEKKKNVDEKRGRWWEGILNGGGGGGGAGGGR
ncbi:MAG: hypothetical protein M1816_005021 [Peltula sp. TS41687]|nr:MAG: hypothetical protein M1816_005021 [Peltula sp. TS41687]